MIICRLLLGIDAIAAAVIVYFFVVGLADGSVSSFNIGLWAAILGVVAVVLAGGWKLQANGRRGLASVVLAVLAIPAIVFGLFVLSLVVFRPHWN